jgi:hypothetical protein
VTGRPSKLTPELGQQIIARVRAGASRLHAARSVGVSKSTLQRWLAKGRVAKTGLYAEFTQGMLEADGHAYVTAEIEVKRTKPLEWLKYRQNRPLSDDVVLQLALHVLQQAASAAGDMEGLTTAERIEIIRRSVPLARRDPDFAALEDLM